MRVPTLEDIQYRSRQRKEFPEKIKKLGHEQMLCFHGTDIKGAKNILLRGEISSGADRTGHATSFDPPGLISVTNKDTVDTSVGTYMNIDSNYCYPAGCLFAVTPADKAEYDALPSGGWMIKNVDFKANPERLQSVVTTPENVERVKGWAKEAGIDAAKVMDFDAFVQKYVPQREVSLALYKNLMPQNTDKR